MQSFRVHIPHPSIIPLSLKRYLDLWHICHPVLLASSKSASCPVIQDLALLLQVATVLELGSVAFQFPPFQEQNKISVTYCPSIPGNIYLGFTRMIGQLDSPTPYIHQASSIIKQPGWKNILQQGIIKQPDSYLLYYLILLCCFSASLSLLFLEAKRQYLRRGKNILQQGIIKHQISKLSKRHTIQIIMV